MESGRLLNALPVNLRKFVLEAWPVLQQLKFSEKIADFTVALPELKSLLQKDIKSVGEVIRYLNTVLTAIDEEQAAVAKTGGLVKFPPVILIDEANKLATWGDEGQKDLQALLDWLLFVSKQKGQAHAVLVTSEYAFSDWLSQRIPAEFVRVAVIGNFEEGDARSFFEKEVGTPVADAEWDMCHKLLDGNAGFLKRCAGPFRRKQDMSAALDDIVQPIKSAVRSSVNPVKAVGYTSAAFLTVARAVLAADENRVPTAEILMLLKALDTATNENATLRALVQCNVVTVRPVSEWAFDIPRSSFGDWEELVMAPSAVHLCAWKMVLPPLIQAWEAEEAAAKKATASAGAWALLARAFNARKMSDKDDSSGAAK
ncbi:hypothetical protein KFL_008470050 [Klebsormidium nitens]|uniref:ATPase AAA-type core domain-containing protein n=1 Tax=Klebsormidium nitens TaxID=105231 RepID=A0A1Y1IQL3_KLENI|nr:hypothetical protein KFL_008470050 [Klebsormidium nitens]|eukprot:GAQ91759.1 hypothetical protein KFL_008470050 [Klebsormidium nitens]